MRLMRGVNLDVLVNQVDIGRFKNLLKDVIIRIFKVDISGSAEDFLADIERLEKKLSGAGVHEKSTVLSFVCLCRSFFFSKVTLREFCYSSVVEEFSKIVEHIGEIEEEEE